MTQKCITLTDKTKIAFDELKGKYGLSASKVVDQLMSEHFQLIALRIEHERISKELAIARNVFISEPTI